MSNDWLQKWNERFGKAEYAYGTKPNNYLKQQLGNLKVGSILFPAEGEGRRTQCGTCSKIGLAGFRF